MRLAMITARLPDGVRRLVPAAFILLMTVLAYWPAIRYGGFVSDDRDNITTNTLLRSASGLRDIWTRMGPGEGGTVQYYPLTYTSFWLEYRLWGLRPFGYHLNNVLLHGLNAVLLWLILLRLRVPGALLAAAVFALHPVHVESVAWVTERKNVLSGLFYFLSLLSFIRFFGLDERSEGKPSSRLAGGRSWYYLGLALFVCALASKTATLTLPAAILLLMWRRTGRIERRDLPPMVPLFLSAVLAGLVTLHVEQYPGVDIGDGRNISIMEHILLAGRIVWFYAGKLLWPHPLMIIYPRWHMDQAAWAQYLFPLALAAVLAVLWLARGRIGRGPLAALLFFIVTLSPVLGFLDTQFMQFSDVTDHFQYLPSLGLISLAAAGAAAGWRGLFGAGRSKRAYALFAALLLSLGGLTWRQSRIYASELLLFEDAVRKNPEAWPAHYNLGVVLAGPDASGNMEKSMAHYRESLRLKPDHPQSHNNLGLALAKLGRAEEAIAHYREAVRFKPDHSGARYNWGLALASLGRKEEAVAQYREALRLKPDYSRARNNLGLALAALGRKEEAVAQYREALRLDPDCAEVLNSLGITLTAMGRTEEAAAQHREALRLRPEDPDTHYNLGIDLAALGRMEEAAVHYREALRLRPDDPEIHNNLGVALSGLGRTEEAIEHYREALRLRPSYAEARHNLKIDLAALGASGGKTAAVNAAVR